MKDFEIIIQIYCEMDLKSIVGLTLQTEYLEEKKNILFKWTFPLAFAQNTQEKP